MLISGEGVHRMTDFRNYDYLRKHNVITLEDLMGLSVYHVYPTLGIVGRHIRKLEYTLNKMEWFFVTDCAHRISELGRTIFLDYDEAHDYHISIMEEYFSKNGL